MATNETGIETRRDFYEVLKTNDGARQAANTLISGQFVFGIDTPLILAIAGATGATRTAVVAYLTEPNRDEKAIIEGNFIGEIETSN